MMQDRDRDPKDFEIVSKPEQLRALGHAERLSILHLLSEAELTGAQVAIRLGLPANRVHYHLGQLLRHGFVRECGRGRKRWQEERFYRATARHFLIDPAVGGADRTTSNTLLRSAELAFLNWRREEVLNIDLGSFARKIVHECARICPGERVLVMFTPPALELGESIAVQIEAIGALPVVKLWSRNVVFRTLDAHTEESLDRLPFLPPQEDESLQAVIYLSTSIPQGGPPSGERIKKLPKLLESVSRWQRSLRQRRVRYLEVALPHHDGFLGGDLSPEEGLDAYWRSLDADYPLLRARAERLLERVGAGKRFILRDEKGTDLTIEVDLTRPHVSDGILSPDDLARGRSYEELPAGSLAFLPIPGSAAGTFVSDYTYSGGIHVKGLRLEIAHGKVIRFTAREGEEFLRQHVARSVGDWNVVSEVRVGLHQPCRGLSGVPALDACMAGVVSLGTGNNELLGGEIGSTLTLGLPSRNVTMMAGDSLLLLEGSLVEP